MRALPLNGQILGTKFKKERRKKGEKGWIAKAVCARTPPCLRRGASATRSMTPSRIRLAFSRPRGGSVDTVTSEAGPRRSAWRTLASDEGWNAAAEPRLLSAMDSNPQRRHVHYRPHKRDWSVFMCFMGISIILLCFVFLRKVILTAQYRLLLRFFTTI